jgi:hypothetical protein
MAEKIGVYDSIRLDCSSLPPQRTKTVEMTARRMNLTILHSLGSFIPPEVVAKNKDILQRIMIVDDLESFALNWETSIKKSKTPLSEVCAVSFREQGIVVILDPNIEWNNLDNDYKQERVNYYGNEDVARNNYVYDSLQSTLLHEILHQYQDRSLPSAFLESAVRYYTRSLIFSNPPQPGNDTPAAFYALLIEKYGDDVHRVFFNSPEVSSTRKKEITTHISRKSRRLFPQSQGL